MTFDSRSIQHLRELGRQLPNELPQPDTGKETTKNRKYHPIETEQDPQALFKELMNASPDGNVPSHLIDRLREVEAKQLLKKNSHPPAQTNNPTKPLARKETEKNILYTSFDKFLLEEED